MMEFKKAADLDGWHAVTDDVIGGESKGAIAPSGRGTAIFEGTISQKAGGFVTVRSPGSAFDVGGMTGVELRVRGDGKSYQILLKTDDKDNGLEYLYYFQTQEGQWQTLRLPFDGFKANFRGIMLPGLRLDPAKIVSAGFLIANYQQGAFKLEIESIKAYR
jgi:monofunctional biosynthetic peptidoglycan transglycosylase